MEKVVFSLDLRIVFRYSNITMNFSDDNICTFITKHSNYGDLHILHLVYETKRQRFDGWKTAPYYRMHFVTQGEGVLHTQNGEYRLSAGDVFFCLPSTPYAIQSIKDFHYAYIAYLGERANATAHKFGINIKNCVFSGFQRLSSLWKECTQSRDEVSSLMAEGTLLYTLSAIATTNLPPESRRNAPQTAFLIKKFIDENFADADLSLQTLCSSLSYSPKYISKLFKKAYQVSFKEYLNIIRINNACALISKGFSSVKELAFLCGFNDPLYFSKVFKAKTTQAPSEYITTIQAKLKK